MLLPILGALAGVVVRSVLGFSTGLEKREDGPARIGSKHEPGVSKAWNAVAGRDRRIGLRDCAGGLASNYVNPNMPGLAPTIKGVTPARVRLSPCESVIIRPDALIEPLSRRTADRSCACVMAGVR
jgi:hypothetical protein